MTQSSFSLQTAQPPLFSAAAFHHTYAQLHFLRFHTSHRSPRCSSLPNRCRVFWRSNFRLFLCHLVSLMCYFFWLLSSRSPIFLDSSAFELNWFASLSRWGIVAFLLCLCFAWGWADLLTFTWWCGSSSFDGLHFVRLSLALSSNWRVARIEWQTCPNLFFPCAICLRLGLLPELLPYLRQTPVSKICVSSLEGLSFQSPKLLHLPVCFPGLFSHF